MKQRSRPAPASRTPGANARKEERAGGLPELLEGETENQAASAMDRLSSRLHQERRVARARWAGLGLAALVLLAWAVWRSLSH